MTAIEDSLTKKKPRHPERPLLGPESAQRIDRWIETLAPRLSGRRLARADIINWLIMTRSEDLSDGELAALHDLHYDPVRALEWAVRAAKEAQARGEQVDVQEIVTKPNFRPATPSTSSRRKRNQAKPKVETEASVTAGSNNVVGEI